MSPSVNKSGTNQYHVHLHLSNIQNSHTIMLVRNWNYMFYRYFHGKQIYITFVRRNSLKTYIALDIGLDKTIHTNTMLGALIMHAKVSLFRQWCYFQEWWPDGFALHCPLSWYIFICHWNILHMAKELHFFWHFFRWSMVDEEIVVVY